MSSLHVDPPGTRSIHLEIEVPGAPEEVWQAIATGPGITAWFVPTELEERTGGVITMSFGPGMDFTGQVTEWDPPHRFTSEVVQELPEIGERRMACTWLVEAHAGSTCVVRLVNSGFLSGAEWDAEYDGMEAGWRLFLYNLFLYRTHFPGQRCSSILVNGMASGPRQRAWDAFMAALGIQTPVVGQHVAATAPGAPPLAGTVERAADGMLTLRTDAPTSGIAFVAAEGSGEHIATSFYGYFFGDDAAAVAARDEPAWRTWMETAFPIAAATPDVASSSD